MSETVQETVSAEIASLIAGAQDSLTDDMVARLSANVSQSLDMLDRLNRSGIDRALPTIACLVENGDLERLVGLARLFGAVEDSVTDDIVCRLSGVMTELASLVDKLARNEGVQRLIDVLGQEEVQTALVGLLGAAATASSEAAKAPPSRGGIGGMFSLMTDPATQDAMRFMVLLSKAMKKS